MSGSEVVKLEEKKVEQVKTKGAETIKERERHETESNSTIEADEIIVKPDGSIVAKGGAIAKVHTKGKGEKDKEAEKLIEREVNRKEENNASSEIKVKEKRAESVSKPSGSGIIYGAIAVLIVGLGVMAYLGIKIKRQ